MRTTIVIAALGVGLAVAPAAISQDADSPPTVTVATLKAASGGNGIGLAHLRTTGEGKILGKLLTTGLPAGQAVDWTVTDRCDGTLTRVIGNGTADSQGVLAISRTENVNKDEAIRTIMLKSPGEQGDVLACGTARTFRVAPTATPRTGVVLTSSFFGPNTNVLTQVLARPRGRARLEAALSGLRPGRTYGLALSRRACGRGAGGGIIARARLRASPRGTAFANTRLDDEATASSVRAVRSVQVSMTGGGRVVRVGCARAHAVDTLR